MITRTERRQSGQIIVVFALGLLAIALTVGLVVDGGTAFLQRRDGQNDADLAALAGTKAIADAWLGVTAATRADVFATIQRRLIAGGCQPSGLAACTWTATFVGPDGADLLPVSSGDSSAVAGPGLHILGVRVDVTRRPRTFFLGLIGQTSWRVVTTATALTAHPDAAPAHQLLPLALRDPGSLTPFVSGQVYDLTPDRIAPGGFAWIDWSKGGEDISGSVCSPDNPILNLGKTTVPRAAPGSDWSQVHKCLAAWQKTGSTVLIPIYDIAAGAPTPPTYRIVSVAAFVIRSLDQPNGGDIQASFVGTYAYPSAPKNAQLPPNKDDSLYYLGLVN